MMKRFFATTLLFYVLMTFVGCNVEIPEEVIQPDKMENILYDYHLAQVITANQSSLSYEKKMHINYVFEKHGVTKELFDSSLVWYTRYPKHILRIYSNLEDKIKAEVEAMNTGGELADVLNAEKMLADTVDLWNDSKIRLLSSAPLCNRINFSYTADTTYVKGDSIVFAFNAKFLQGTAPALRRNAHAALVVAYDDATSVSRGVQITADKNYILAVNRTTDKKIKSLNGFVYYSDNDTLCLSKMLLSDIAVKRIHPAKK